MNAPVRVERDPELDADLIITWLRGELPPFTPGERVVFVSYNKYCGLGILHHGYITKYRPENGVIVLEPFNERETPLIVKGRMDIIHDVIVSLAGKGRIKYMEPQPMQYEGAAVVYGRQN